MKILKTRTHAWLDYIVGLLLIAAPWALGFASDGAETWIPVILGIGTIGYSLCTDYEFGLVPALSMRTHLALDMMSGIFLAASPWLFDFNDYVWQPHLIVGLMEIVVVLISKRYPEAERRHHGVAPRGDVHGTTVGH